MPVAPRKIGNFFPAVIQQEKIAFQVEKATEGFGIVGFPDHLIEKGCDGNRRHGMFGRQQTIDIKGMVDSREHRFDGGGVRQFTHEVGHAVVQGQEGQPPFFKDRVDRFVGGHAGAFPGGPVEDFDNRCGVGHSILLQHFPDHVIGGGIIHLPLVAQTGGDRREGHQVAWAYGHPRAAIRFRSPTTLVSNTRSKEAIVFLGMN